MHLHENVAIIIVQSNDEKLDTERLLKMAKGVAQGMDYLSIIGFVHRVRTTAWLHGNFRGYYIS